MQAMGKIYVTVCICLMTIMDMMAQPDSPDNGLTLRQRIRRRNRLPARVKAISRSKSRNPPLPRDWTMD